MSRKDDEYLLRLLEEKKRRERTNRIAYMYPDKDNMSFHDGVVFSRDRYPKHLEFFKAGANFRQRLFCAGNRVGKSFSGISELVYHTTGDYPSWWDGKKFDRPIQAWIGGMSLKTMRDSVQYGLLGRRGDFGTGLLPQEKILRTRVAPGVPDAIETIDVKHKSGGTSTIALKTYESGLEGFVGAAVDVIMLDEEPPLNVYTECLMRTATTNGIVYVTFTPDRGFSETVLAFFDNGNFREGQVGQKWVTVCGWDNAPHLSEQTKRELWTSIPPHLRDAKTKGIPYLGSGAIYPLLEEDIVCKPFNLDEHSDWPRAYAFDVGWNKNAAVWGAWDPQSDIIYLYSEYYRGYAEPSIHASAIKSRGDWMAGVIDKASRGRSQVDGAKLIDVYTELGLNIVPSLESKTVESGIQKVFERLSTGRLKIFSTMQNWLAEFRIYRRDDKGKIIKANDHLMDATRYLVEHFQMICQTKPDDFADDEYIAESVTGRNEVTGY